MGALNKPSQVIVLVEGQRDERFVRQYLYQAGYEAHRIFPVPLASGRGAGEQRVRARVRKNVDACRARARRAATALIVMIDADVGEVLGRQQQLRDLLGPIEARKDGEPIVHLIPKRNIETWVLCLTMTIVSENEDYHLLPAC